VPPVPSIAVPGLAPTPPGRVCSYSAASAQHRPRASTRKLKNDRLPDAEGEECQYAASGDPRVAPGLAPWQREELLQQQAAYHPYLDPVHMHGQSHAAMEPLLPCGGYEAGGYDAGGYDAGCYEAGVYEAGVYEAGVYEAGGFGPCGFQPPTPFAEPLPAAAAMPLPLHTGPGPICAQPPLFRGQALMDSQAMAGQRMSRGQGSLSAQKLAPVCELGISESLLPQQFLGEQAAASSSHCPLFPGVAPMRRGPWCSPPASSGSSPRGRQIGTTSGRASDSWRYSVKNSFLHVEVSDKSDNDDDEANTDGGSSQRSSSVPSRLEHEEIWEDWHRRNFDGGAQDWGRSVSGDDPTAHSTRLSSSSPAFHPHGLKCDVDDEQHQASMMGMGHSIPSAPPRDLGTLFQM